MKRIFLFVLTNLAVVFLLGLMLRLFGLDRLLLASGLSPPSLLIYATIFGFGGSILSLLLSKSSALWMTGAKIIGSPRNSGEYWLLETVRRQAEAAGIGVPDVAVYPSEEINAFATGASRNSALVAVSSGLLNAMEAEEAEAVLGHEVTHIANGDMVTLTLLQGVLNTFVLFLSRAIGAIVDRVVFRNERGMGVGYFLTVFALQIFLGLFAAIIVCWFSRQREFRADRGGARLAGTEKMIRALERLGVVEGRQALPRSLSAFGISGDGGILDLLRTHPPIAERIAALRETIGR